MKVTAKLVELVKFEDNVRSNTDQRRRVDRYTASYSDGRHEWRRIMEVEVGSGEPKFGQTIEVKY